ncbi:MAG TPA: helicase-related protein, partial [Gemmatimonadaceae bacterium]|nr:helicase-related protein [Gemmatimonadaceae bacterium]
MRGDVAELPAARVRATIARLWLRDDDGHGRPPAARARGEQDAATRTLGSITLRSHQADAARRLARALDDFGGALLADEVGLGKTYTALAVARSASRPLVVAPAALRDMWRAALDATGVRAPIVSFERLSRTGDTLPPPTRDAPCNLVVVDEAHHARNPATRRYRALARLAEHARVLLLSATPIHNRRADLDALLALFLGGRSRTLGDRDLARVVVRRGPSTLDARDDGAAPLPSVAPLRWLRPPADDSVLDTLLSLPPPLPPRDSGDGGALVVHGLVRQWASSDAALRAAVARRLAVCTALADALARGRHPTRADLGAWVAGPDAVQLAFAELLVEGAPLARGDELLAAVREHERALRELDARLRASDAAADDARASLLAGVVARHRGEKVVAFASYAETVTALFRRLRHATRVAALTGGGAVVAGGRIPRREALARFAPVASGAPPPREAERVELLLATDLLSEGVNLQDASVVVHLDLPWTEARLAQRVGRAARLGARHRKVAVYALAPPATAERILEVEARLREKARVAGVAIGPMTGPSFPGASTETVRSGPGDAERTREV